MRAIFYRFYLSTSTYSAEPMRPNSSAPQLPKMMDLRGLQFPARTRTERRCKLFILVKKKKSLINALTLLDLLAKHSAQLQHDRRPAAGVDGTVNPAVPVVPIDHVSVCGHQRKHTRNQKLTTGRQQRRMKKRHISETAGSHLAPHSP